MQIRSGERDIPSLSLNWRGYDGGNLNKPILSFSNSDQFKEKKRGIFWTEICSNDNKTNTNIYTHNKYSFFIFNLLSSSSNIVTAKLIILKPLIQIILAKIKKKKKTTTTTTTFPSFCCCRVYALYFILHTHIIVKIQRSIDIFITIILIIYVTDNYFFSLMHIKNKKKTK